MIATGDGIRLPLHLHEGSIDNPASISSLIQKIRPDHVYHLAGYDDGEILEINQVAAYFAYANRTVLGLGCSTEGDILGLSPGASEDPDDWSHH